MAENKLAELSIDFAVEILKMCDSIKGHYSIVKQLERSATSRDFQDFPLIRNSLKNPFLFCLWETYQL